MAPATNPAAYLNGNFLVEIDGLLAAAFMEVSGLEATIEIIEYRSGDAKQAAVQKLPGLHKFTNITLKRGLVQDLSLWNWMQSGLNGNVERRAVSILLLDSQRNPVWRWNLTNAWPCKYTGPVLKAESDEVAIETLEICYENLTVFTGT
jgi:phage tail-like protein